MKKAKLKIEGNIGDNDPFFSMLGIADENISAKIVGDFIDSNPDADVLEIEISSNGGSVSVGFDIYDKLRNSGKKIVTKGYRVNSIATVIFLAGDERYLSKNAEFIVHNPWIDPNGLGNMPLTSEILEQISADVKYNEEKIFNFYVEKLNLNDSDKTRLKDLMYKDTDLGSELAINLGFATGYLEDYRSKTFAYSELVLNLYKSNNSNFKQMENSNIETRLNGLEKLATKISNFFKTKTLNLTATLSDGTPVYFDGETLEVGLSLWLDESYSTPVPDAEHILENGDVVVTVDGIVTEIRKIETELQPETEVSVEELKLEIERLTNENTMLKANNEKFENDFNALNTEVATLQNEINSFKQIVAGDKKPNVKNNVSLKPWEQRLQSDKKIRESFK